MIYVLRDVLPIYSRAALELQRSSLSFLDIPDIVSRAKSALEALREPKPSHYFYAFFDDVKKEHGRLASLPIEKIGLLAEKSISQMPEDNKEHKDSKEKVCRVGILLFLENSLRCGLCLAGYSSANSSHSSDRRYTFSLYQRQH
jgi:hypothetical protein